MALEPGVARGAEMAGSGARADGWGSEARRGGSAEGRAGGAGSRAPEERFPWGVGGDARRGAPEGGDPFGARCPLPTLRRSTRAGSLRAASARSSFASSKAMALSSPSYYSVLGVEPSASPEGIREAFRREAMRWHPDRRPGDPSAAEHFREVHAAYEILSNPERRRAYDLSGADPGAQASDIEVQVTLGLREIFTGVLLKVEVPRAHPCPGCGGMGAVLREGRSLCRACAGSGWGPLRTLYGVSARAPCPVCRGSGGGERQWTRSPCTTCHGIGSLLSRTFLEVRLPPGLEEGARIRVPGQGHPLLRGGSGDLLLAIHLRRGAWSRAGPDVYFDLPVREEVRCRGGRIPVVTPLERLNVRIPRGAPWGTTLSLRGRGLPRPSGEGRGTLFLRLVP